MLVPSLLGGLFIGVLSALPFVNVANCCCLWIVTGGMLSAWVLQQNESEPIGTSRGALVGLLAGIAGALIWLVVTIVLDPIVVPFQQRMLATIAPNATDLPPQMREMLDAMSEPDAAPVRWATGVLGQLFLGTVFSTLGGLIGSSILRPPSHPVVPPPLPPTS